MPNFLRMSRILHCIALYKLSSLISAQSSCTHSCNSMSVVVSPQGQPRPDGPPSQLAHLVQPMPTKSVVPRTHPSAPRAIALAMSSAVLTPPLAISVTLSLTPSFCRNLWTLGIASSIGMAMFFLAISGAAPVPLHNCRRDE